MHHLQLQVLIPQTPISPLIHGSLINNYTHKIELFSSSPVFHNGCYTIIIKTPPLLAARQRSSSRNIGRWVVFAVERESKFEVDQDKARQALDELDQQLESLSNKQVTPPKIRAASSLSTLKDERKEEASSEISGSFLAVLAFGLFAFSIFYNILFLTVIKPSIDGPDDIVATDISSTEAISETLQN